MKHAFLTRPLAALAVSAAGLAFASVPALAQDNEITITAPYAVHHNVGETSAGIPIDRVAISRNVGFGDLDLTKPWGVRALERRVGGIARMECRQINLLYANPGLTSDDDCVRGAVDNSLARIGLVVVASR